MTQTTSSQRPYKTVPSGVGPVWRIRNLCLFWDRYRAPSTNYEGSICVWTTRRVFRVADGGKVVKTAP